MKSTNGHSDQRARREALLRAVRLQRPQHSTALLRRHPAADELVESYATERSTDVGKLLWDDLATQYESLPESARRRDWLEKFPARLEALKWMFASTRQKFASSLPMAYWLRRRFLAQRLERQRSAEGLPPFPRQLSQMEFSQFSTLCQSVGCEMIACAAVLETPQSLVRWLSPLGTQGARAVADRLLVLRDHPLPTEIRRRWQAAYKRYLHQYRGTQLASMLGLSVLAAIYQRLPAAERELVDALADTGVREALGRTGRDDAYPDDDLIAVQAIAIRVLSAGAAIQRDGE